MAKQSLVGICLAHAERQEAEAMHQATLCCSAFNRLSCVQADTRSQLLLGSAWPMLEHELAEAVQQAIHVYWRLWRKHQTDEELFIPEIQVSSKLTHLPSLA